MKEDIKLKDDDYISCVGDYNREDIVCKNCSVRLHCLLEKEDNTKLEVMQELFFSDTMTKHQLN